MNDKTKIRRSNPFPGMRAFRTEESSLFFGRIESTAKVTRKLMENRFVAILGATGSGKSSLVFAGVIPALLRENSDGRKTWSFISVRPGANPVDNLAREIASLSSEAGFSQVPEATISATLNNRSEGLNEILNKIRKNLRQQVVIVIDQFDEIFRFSQGLHHNTEGDGVAAFIDIIVSALQQPDQGIYVIMTIRSEYVAECSRFLSLTSLMNASSYLLPQLNRDSLATVIEEPLKTSGVSIDRTLVRLIISEMGDQQGQLPVLQHLLSRMWNQWNKWGDTNRSVSLTDYDAVGTIKGAISQHAAQAFDSLDERERYVCSRLFRSITIRNEDGREVRKPEKVSVIVSLTGCQEHEIIKVADLFRGPDISFLSPSAEEILQSDTVLDLTHESIIRNWNALRRWIDDEEESVKMYRRLAAAAESYQEGKGKLWSPPDLTLAVRWRDRDNPTLAWAERIDPAFERTMLFLKNSEEENAVQEEYKKKAGSNKVKRSRFIAGMLGILVILSVLALGFVFSLKSRAEKQRSVALQIKNETAALNSMLTDSLSLMADTLMTKTLITDSAIMEAVAATEQKQAAEEMAADAGRKLKAVTVEKDNAASAAVAETRRKMLAVSRSLALRSLSHAGDRDVQILLARQAYLFNQEYSGSPDDPDLFAALYDVSNRYGNRYFTDFTPDGARVTAVAGDEEGQVVYTADNQGRVMQWRTDQRETGYKMIWKGDKVIEAMTLSPDAAWLACGTENSEIIMIPLNSDMVSYQLSMDAGRITGLIFAESGDHLYSSSGNGTMALWNLRTRKAEALVSVDKGVKAYDVSGDKNLLAAITDDGKVMLWHAGDTSRPYILDAGERKITSVKFIQQGGGMVTGDDKGVIDIWNGETHHSEMSIEGHSSPITAIAINSENNMMVTGTEGGEVKLWTLADLSIPPATVSVDNSRILDLGFSKKGNAFLATTATGIKMRPAKIQTMVADLCNKVSRNLTPAEWAAWVGLDIAYVPTCPDKTYQIRVREIRSVE